MKTPNENVMIIIGILMAFGAIIVSILFHRVDPDSLTCKILTMIITISPVVAFLFLTSCIVMYR